MKQPSRVCRRNSSWQKCHHLVEDLSRALRRERLHIKECAGFVMVGGLVGGQERLLQLRVRGSRVRCTERIPDLESMLLLEGGDQVGVLGGLHRDGFEGKLALGTDEP